MSRTREEQAAYMREWRKTPAYEAQKNSPAYKEQRFKANLKSRYGLTPEWVDEKYTEQDGKCAICKSPIYYNILGTRSDKTFSIHVDHDHKTGNPRGLLCQNCNIALGKLQDDKDIIYAAYEYLVYHGQG